MAANLEAIHRALADQLRANISRDIDTNPFDINPPTFPAITVLTDSPYIDYWDTFGPNGKAVMKLRLRLDVEGDPESMAIQICAYLSIGTGNTSSIADAVHLDKTLGGLVEQCIVLSAEFPNDSEPGVAWVPVQIILGKTLAVV